MDSLFSAAMLSFSRFLKTLIEPVISVLICLPILCFVDSNFIKGRRLEETRWFAIHAFANLFVSLFAFPSLIFWFLDPTHAMDESKYPQPPMFAGPTFGTFLRALFHPASNWPIMVINSIHLYHFIAFSELSRQDKIHHLLFVSVLGIYFGALNECGPAKNVGCFFISGFPGGLDYAMLCLVNLGKMKKITEKRINSLVNTWIRAPGLVLTAGTFHLGWISGKTKVSFFKAYMVAVMVLVNGLFYMRVVVDNFGASRTHESLAQIAREKTKEKKAEIIKEKSLLSTNSFPSAEDLTSALKGRRAHSHARSISASDVDFLSQISKERSPPAKFLIMHPVESTSNFSKMLSPSKRND